MGLRPFAFVVALLLVGLGSTFCKFFEEMGAGKTPEVAMFITRKDLARRYESDDLVRWLWRAFPFRVNQLN